GERFHRAAVHALRHRRKDCGTAGEIAHAVEQTLAGVAYDPTQGVESIGSDDLARSNRGGSLVDRAQRLPHTWNIGHPDYFVLADVWCLIIRLATIELVYLHHGATAIDGAIQRVWLCQIYCLAVGTGERVNP